MGSDATHELDDGPPSRSARRWYGHQTLTADLIAFTAVVYGGVAQMRPVIYSGAATYALGGPAVHAWHGHWGKAAGSLGLRVGAPLTFATVAFGSPEN